MGYESGEAFKEGIENAGNALNRIKKLQTGNPYEIKELYKFQTSHNHKLEKTIHRYFSHCKDCNPCHIHWIRNFSNSSAKSLSILVQAEYSEFFKELVSSFLHILVLEE
jgi:hypothetical protein